MTTNIISFPDRPERTWKYITDPLRDAVIKRTWSAHIADAVVGRAKDVLDRCVPLAVIKDAVTPEERERQAIDYIHNLLGKLIGEIGLLAEEIELLKQAS